MSYNQSIFRMIGASNHSLTERELNDYYATAPQHAEELLSVENFDKNIWECAVGGGHIADVLKKHGHKVFATDIVARGYKNTKCAKNGEFEKYSSSAVAYAWFIWEKGYKGNPIIKWI